MKCEHCDNEATVHETTIVKGASVERHLCESCASKTGLGAPQPAAPGQITGFVLQAGAGLVIQGGARPVTACPRCLMTFAEFKQHGHLGCADCYVAFESQLLPLIERAHEGGEKHVGKIPRQTLDVRGAGLSTQERLDRMQVLQRELEAAVAAEQYELAAKLRDELRRLVEPAHRGGPAVGES